MLLSVIVQTTITTKDYYYALGRAVAWWLGVYFAVSRFQNNCRDQWESCSPEAQVQGSQLLWGISPLVLGRLQDNWALIKPLSEGAGKLWDHPAKGKGSCQKAELIKQQGDTSSPLINFCHFPKLSKINCRLNFVSILAERWFSSPQYRYPTQQDIGRYHDKRYILGSFIQASQRPHWKFETTCAPLTG